MNMNMKSAKLLSISYSSLTFEGPYYGIVLMSDDFLGTYRNILNELLCIIVHVHSTCRCTCILVIE